MAKVDLASGEIEKEVTTDYRNIAALTRFMPIYQTRREKSIENIYCLAKE